MLLITFHEGRTWSRRNSNGTCSGIGYVSSTYLTLLRYCHIAETHPDPTLGDSQLLRNGLLYTFSNSIMNNSECIQLYWIFTRPRGKLEIHHPVSFHDIRVKNEDALQRMSVVRFAYSEERNNTRIEQNVLSYKRQPLPQRSEFWLWEATYIYITFLCWTEIRVNNFRDPFVSHRNMHV